MSKPLNENIRDVRVVNEKGDLHPVLDHAGEKFAELIKAVSSTGKSGSLTLKIDIKPSTAGAMAVKADVKVTMPKSLPAEALLWPTPEGNLLNEDPRQTKLELKPVETQATELKAVTA